MMCVYECSVCVCILVWFFFSPPEAPTRDFSLSRELADVHKRQTTFSIILLSQHLKQSPKCAPRPPRCEGLSEIGPKCIFHKIQETGNTGKLSSAHLTLKIIFSGSISVGTLLSDTTQQLITVDQ